MGTKQRHVQCYNLTMVEVFTIRMPFGAEIIRIEVVRDTPKLWAIVDNFTPIDYTFMWFLDDAIGVQSRKTYIGSIWWNEKMNHLFREWEASGDRE